jgi:hypothetical protein
MKYVLLIYQGTTPLPGSPAWNALSPEKQKAVYADYKAFGETPGVEQGLPLGLPDAARTVQVCEGKIHVNEGTYLTEGVGGYSVIEADDMEAAIALARRIPAARMGGAVEVRPVEQYW